MTGAKYYVLWYDSKMKNYELFVKYLTEKKMMQADIHPMLVVDKEEHMDKIDEIWKSSESDYSA